MLSRDRVSLNALAFDSTCKLIDGVLARGVNLAEAYIDALGDTTKHKVRASLGEGCLLLGGILCVWWWWWCGGDGGGGGGGLCRTEGVLVGVTWLG